MDNFYINHINKCFDNVNNNITKLTNDIFELSGMSGKKTRIFYNNLLNVDIKLNYLEIGVFMGSTFISALYNNKNINAYAIDNFGQYSAGSGVFINNISKYLINNEKYTIIQQDCFDTISKTITDKIDIYLYDAGHSYDDHRRSLLHYLPIMNDIFIFIVDDWNYEDVRCGTLDGIKESNVTVLFEKEIRLTYDNTTTPEPLLSEDYWNGLYIAVLKKN